MDEIMTTYTAKVIYCCENCGIAVELSAEKRSVIDAEHEVISTYKMFEQAHLNSQRHKEILLEQDIYNKEIVAYING